MPRPSPSDPLSRNLAGLDLPGLLESARAEAESGVLTPEALSALLPAYEVQSLLGRGGMGAVYRARQRTLDRTVALKVLPPEVGADVALAARFRREAQVLARLEHPYIVAVHEFGISDGGHLFFTMDLVEGGDLATRLKAGAVEAADALRWLREICSALEYAHAQGVIHRDVKPSNILLTPDGHVKVADFGLAVLERGSDTPKLTRSGVAVGTLEYAAPEQLAGRADQADARSDVYSLGVLAYELLTGELPRGAFKPPSQLRPGLSRVFDNVITRAMRQDPAERFASPAEFRHGLAGSPSARHRRWLWPAAALLLGGALWLWISPGAPPATPAEESAWLPLYRQPEDFGGHRGDFPITGDWILMTSRNLVTPVPVKDGSLRVTLRYHRDSASLTARYGGHAYVSCGAFISGEGTLAALTITAVPEAGIAATRQNFPLPRALKDGDEYTLETGTLDDQLYVAFDGKRIGWLQLPPGFPRTGLLGVLPSSRSTPAEVRDIAWKIHRPADTAAEQK